MDTKKAMAGVGLATALLISGCSSATVATTLGVGVCYNLDEGSGSETPVIVACSEPHFAEVVGTLSMEDINAMDEETLFSGAMCDDAFLEYVGIPQEWSKYYVYLYLDDETELTVCSAASEDFSDIVGSVKDSKK
ncbi:MAG: septum formation family protein [Demequinaceae bacterium]|nr:septum formation family protein [Demequinaceae bacterium]